MTKAGRPRRRAPAIYTARTVVSLRPADMDRAERYADTDGVSLAGLLRDAICEYLARREREASR